MSTCSALWWVSFPNATFGLVSDGAGRVVDCAPYVRKNALGRDVRVLVRGYRAAGAKVALSTDCRCWCQVRPQVCTLTGCACIVHPR